MPRDGGTAKGYITFLITTEQTQAKNGVWAVEALSNYNEATLKSFFLQYLRKTEI